MIVKAVKGLDNFSHVLTLYSASCDIVYLGLSKSKSSMSTRGTIADSVLSTRAFSRFLSQNTLY